MRLTKFKLSGVILALTLGCAAMVLNGCKSTDDVATATHGANAGDGYTYGTGPNKTKPYPQTEQVVIKGVGGAKVPNYEAVSRGGNKDYRVLGNNYMVWKGCKSYQEIGTASWYGPGFHGNNTSNGEYYDQKGYTAAHKNLPLPSYVKVTNLENGKMVIVRVNDRGPFHGSRIIDLSEGAAKYIDMTRKGTAKVKLELIDVRGGSNISSETASTSKNSKLDKIISQVIKASGSSSSNAGASTAGKIFTGAVVAGKVISAINKNTNKNLRNSDSSNYSVNYASVVDEDVAATIATDTASSAAREVNNAVAQATSSATTAVTTTSTEIMEAIPGLSFVQVFSSSTQNGAAAMRAKLQKQTPLPVVIMLEDGFYRVRVGPLTDNDLQTTLEYMKQLGYNDAFIKHL